MPSHVFVDENKSRGLLMAAAACVAGDVNAHRRTMRSLLLPRQRRLHFFKESAAHQRKILGVIEGFGLEVKLYATPSDSHAGRERCLNAIVQDAAGTAERLVIERDESRLEFDRRTLYRAVRTYGCVDTLQYELLAPHLDPLLWIPDAVAWSWAKGGEWRQLVAPYSELTEL
ncbi:hypothetical protein ACFV9C_02435 [Kribbella sp. NPDC059898]|uniref:hypothetical protein n=1 Tax=Kribbella sp. NPDC059898 TaxID=3346995 RepID=UPI00365398C7